MAVVDSDGSSSRRIAAAAPASLTDRAADHRRAVPIHAGFSYTSKRSS
jgi:hypothetical protein